MKRLLLMLTLAALASLAYSLPTIAVLDALLEDNVDPSAKVPVTEKIIEEIVGSGKYTVLDRGSIQEVLEEKKFQLSGIVADTEIKKAGEYLGADIVCVAKVSRIGGTYFISGKMIDVETGAITAQKSHEEKGEIEVVLDIAQIVGQALAGGVIEEADKEPQKPAPTVVVEPTPVAPVEQATTDLTPIRRIIVSYLLPYHFGPAVDEIDDLIDYVISESGGYLGEYDFSPKYSGIGAHATYVLGQMLYLSISGAYTSRTVSSDYFFDDENYYTDFTTIDLRAGAGAILRPIEMMQGFIGAGIGYLLLTMDEDLWGTNFFTYSMEDSALAWYFEGGVDLIISDFIVLNATATFLGSMLNEDTILYDQELFTYLSVSAGVGISF